MGMLHNPIGVDDGAWCARQRGEERNQEGQHGSGAPGPPSSLFARVLGRPLRHRGGIRQVPWTLCGLATALEWTYRKLFATRRALSPWSPRSRT